MFSGFMTNAWVAGTIVAVVAGVMGFFVVIRGSAFPAHAIPNGAFTGAAAANVIGIPSLVGLAAAAVLAAVGIGALGRRGRHDVATALALVMMLALGAVFLSRSGQYEPEVYSLLFGEILGVGGAELLPTALLALACIAATALLFRPLMLSSLMPEVAESKGVPPVWIDMAFLLVLALATALTVPVVGALLIFSLMIGPPAAARYLTDRPLPAMGLGVLIALVTIWMSIAISYESNWPVGFFVGSFGAASYGLGRTWSAYRQRRGRKWAGPAPVGLQSVSP